MNVNSDQCDFSLSAVSAVEMVAGTQKAKRRPLPGPAQKPAGLSCCSDWFCLHRQRRRAVCTSPPDGYECGLGGAFGVSFSLCLRLLQDTGTVWAAGQVTRAGHPLRSWLPWPQQLFQLTVCFSMSIFFIVISSFGLGIQKHFIASDSWESKRG